MLEWNKSRGTEWIHVNVIEESILPVDVGNIVEEQEKEQKSALRDKEE